LSFLLTIQGMIATAFVAGLVIGILLPRRWKTFGWGVPIAAAVFAAIRLTQGSAEVSDILFAALWAALGGFPGAALGSWLRTRFDRSA
jgi:hypothetical protein